MRKYEPKVYVRTWCEIIFRGDVKLIEAFKKELMRNTGHISWDYQRGIAYRQSFLRSVTKTITTHP